jgi:hypothetical protein
MTKNRRARYVGLLSLAAISLLGLVSCGDSKTAHAEGFEGKPLDEVSEVSLRGEERRNRPAPSKPEPEPTEPVPTEPEPTEPSTPTTTTTPTTTSPEPTEPSEPAPTEPEPTEPSEPAPTEPTEPSEPAPTEPTEDTTPPETVSDDIDVHDVGSEEELQSLEAIVLSPTSAEITWRTAHFSDSEVAWGRTTGLDGTPVRHHKLERYHTVLLKGLEPGTRYHYRAKSSGASGEVVSSVESFTTLAEDRFTVRSDRPRIYFTSEDLPRLRERIKGSHAAYWEKLRKECSDHMQETSAQLTVDSHQGKNVLADLAFAGRLGGIAEYKKKAIDAALVAAASDPDSVSRGPLRDIPEGMAVVYDWLYDDLTSSQRDTLRKGILRYILRITDGTNDAVYGHGAENINSVVVAALAIYHEESEARSRLASAVRALRHHFFPTWRHDTHNGSAANGGSRMTWSYCMYTMRQIIDAITAMKTATDLDYTKTEEWPNKLVDWMICGMRDDNGFEQVGDGQPYDGFMGRHRHFAVTMASLYRNPRAQWFAQYIESARGIMAKEALYDILFYDPSLQPSSDLGSTSRLFLQSGTVFCRDHWGPGNVQVMFRSFPYYTMGHNQLDANSFTIYYKGGQALDSGYYDEFGSPHHRNYSCRTIAHNTMLVQDPAQKFLFYGKTEFANDGGQHWKIVPDEVPHSRPYHVHELLDPALGYRGTGVFFYEDQSAYTWVAGDAASMYSAKKLKTFDRHLVFLKDVDGFSKPATIVFDWVVSTDAAFKKTYLLHTTNRPAVSGTFLSASHEKGMIFQDTLLPTSPKLTVVGGSGSEFLVAGKNYPIDGGTHDLAEPGAYRVEVSPPAAAKEDYFLHVLFAADAGSSAPPRAQRITSQMLGLELGGWVVLFPRSRTPAPEVSYDLRAGGMTSHLLLAMEPFASYSIVLDGMERGTVKATYNGVVHFESEAASKVTVRRVP